MDMIIYNKNKFGIDGLALKIIAILAMLIDHSRILFPNAPWLNYIGRLALPIFCYLIVEGSYHTQDLKKYCGRLLFFSVVSQIPYMLCIYKSLCWNGFNILFTLLVGLLAISIIDRFKGNKILFICSIILVTIGAQYIVEEFNADGCCVAIYMMVSFYISRNNRVLQLISMLVINGYIASSFNLTTITLGQIMIPIQQQSLAIFSLIPIWLYNGKQGLSNKYIRYGFYVFYPIHLMLLWVIFKLVLLCR